MYTRDPYLVAMTGAYVLLSLVAIVLPWGAFGRTKRDVFIVFGVLNAVFCGLNGVIGVVSLFTPVYPTVFMLLAPVLFVVTLVLYFTVKARPPSNAEMR